MIWALLSLAALLSAAIVTRPWWRRARAETEVDRRATNIAIYQERLAELDKELSSGTLNAGEYENARSELGQRLLADAEATETDPSASTPRGRSWTPILIGILIPALGLSLYALGGQWRMPRAAHEVSQTQVEGLVAQLESRLATSPDPQGFALLGRTYASLGRFADAADAYAAANRLSKDEVADWIAEEAEARALTAHNDWRGVPTERVERALALAPEHPKALFYAGLAAIQRGDQAAAARHWRRLLAQPDLPADIRAVLSQRLAAFDAPTAPAAGREAPVRLHVHVDLAPALRKRAQGMPLFIFAKAASGPPMPLAVQRLGVQQWPVEVTLDDSMAMTPALRLSQFDRWVVTARLSADGDAIAGSGDLQAEKTVEASSSGERVDLTIDEVLQ